MTEKLEEERDRTLKGHRQSGNFSLLTQEIKIKKTKTPILRKTSVQVQKIFFAYFGAIFSVPDFL